MTYGLRALVFFSLLILASCTAINSSMMTHIPHDARWGISVFTNNTEVPQAGYRAMNITAGVLRSNCGVQCLINFPCQNDCNRLIVCPNAVPSLHEVLDWARSEHLNFVMMGAVNEWDYKVGLDGEPIAAVSLQVYEVDSGELIWSSVGSKIGSSRSGLAVIAQRLINEMLVS